MILGICPTHHCELVGGMTQWGCRYDCPVDGCTVHWWGRRNTSPADQATMDARKAAHLNFDRLWQAGIMTRPEACEWLQRTFQLSPDEAHIGLFSKEQCEDLIFAVRRFRVRAGHEEADPQQV